MSDTPRTDQMEQAVKGPNAWSLDTYGAVPADFARELERELAATTEELNRVAKDARAIALKNVSLERENAELRSFLKRGRSLMPAGRWYEDRSPADDAAKFHEDADDIT